MNYILFYLNCTFHVIFRKVSLHHEVVKNAHTNIFLAAVQKPYLFICKQIACSANRISPTTLSSLVNALMRVQFIYLDKLWPWLRDVIAGKNYYTVTAVNRWCCTLYVVNHINSFCKTRSHLSVCVHKVC